MAFLWFSIAFYGLLWKNIVFSRGHRSKFIWSCFSQDSSQIFRFQWLWPCFFTDWMVYFSNMTWWFSFPEIHPVSGYLSGFSRMFINLQILKGLIIFLQIIDFDFLKNDFMIFPHENSSGFRTFSGFFQLSRFQKFWSYFFK